MLAHDRRRIVHFNATAHPTAERTGQQLRQAFPFDQLPRYLLRDRDAIFGADFRTQVTSVWRNCGIRTRLLYYRRFKWFLRGSYEGSINAYKLKLGSQQFLKNRQDTLRVFLYAPPEDKVRRLLARGKSEKEAEQLVDTVDRERVDFTQKYFHVEWHLAFFPFLGLFLCLRFPVSGTGYRHLVTNVLLKLDVAAAQAPGLTVRACDGELTPGSWPFCKPPVTVFVWLMGLCSCFSCVAVSLVLSWFAGS